MQRLSTRRIAARAFTLVELLVVIGIIALLISILLPALNKVKESARAAKCLSNLRQISQATVLFANDNRNWLPSRADKTPRTFSDSRATDKGVGTVALEETVDLSNWLVFKRQSDKYLGTPIPANPRLNITYSSLAKYMSVPRVTHDATVVGSEHQVSATLESVFTCPSDNVLQRPNQNNPSEGYYRYSYSMNDHFSIPIKQYTFTPVYYTNYPTAAPGNQRDGFIFTGRITSIKNPAERILFLCEDEMTLDDGCGKLDPNQWAAGRVNAVSGRHSSRRANSANSATLAKANRDSLGLVAFADGHAAWLGRLKSLTQRHTGSAYSDPPGF